MEIRKLVIKKDPQTWGRKHDFECVMRQPFENKKRSPNMGTKTTTGRRTFHYVPSRIKKDPQTWGRKHILLRLHC